MADILARPEYTMVDVLDRSEISTPKLKLGLKIKCISCIQPAKFLRVQWTAVSHCETDIPGHTSDGHFTFVLFILVTHCDFSIHADLASAAHSPRWQQTKSRHQFWSIPICRL